VSYQNYRRKKSFEQDAVESILKGILWLIAAPFRLLLFLVNRKKTGSKKINYDRVELDRKYIVQKLQEIDQLLNLGNSSNYSRAVMEGDKTLDYVLKGLGLPGETMGERLKSARDKMTYDSYNAAWSAHKIRNEMVHNSAFEVTDFIAKDAVRDFKKAISELI